jgi:hypothetical protein
MLTLTPRDPDVRWRLSWLLSSAPDAAARDGQRALELAQALVAETKGEQPMMLDALACALAELGRFDEARAVLAPYVERNGPGSATLRERMQLFEAHKPYRLD